MSQYISRGMAPLVVGLSFSIVGALSALTSLSSNPIINTPGGNGLDMLASLGVLAVGVGVYRSKSSLSAWLAGGLALSLIVYASVQFNANQAAHVAGAGFNAIRTAAVTAAGDLSAGQGQPQSQSSYSVPAGHRATTPNEKKWCDSNPSNQSLGCTVGYCRISSCGAQGK